MGTILQIAANESNRATANDFRSHEAGLRTNSLVMRAVRSFWPAAKCTKELRYHTRASDRMIQYWLSNKYALSATDLANLLRSDAGFAVLESLMGDAKPAWWAGFKRGVRRAEARRRLAHIEKELADLKQEELDL